MSLQGNADCLPCLSDGAMGTELADKTGGRLRVLQHHGAKRSTQPQDLLDYDVVLVTYQTIAQELSYLDSGRSAAGKKSKGWPCTQISWHRLVLDEAHTAKNPKTGWTRVCSQLCSDNRCKHHLSTCLASL